MPMASALAGVPTLWPSQPYLPLADSNIAGPPPSAHSSPSPEDILNLPPANNPANVSPAVTAAVTNLLSSYDDYLGTTPLVAPPNPSNGGSYPQTKRGWNILKFPPFCSLTSLPGSKVLKFIKEPARRMKTYSRITKKIERLVCVVRSLFTVIYSNFIGRLNNFTSKQTRSV